MKNVVEAIKNADSVLVLTGAGISAASGIPTFRGEEGYWTKDSKNYFPEELATHEFFTEDPRTLFEWYNYRQEICKEAKPNATHRIIKELQDWCEENEKDFLLITQNVDNLHRVAGSTDIVEVHGNIFKYRCSDPYSDHSNTLLDVDTEFEYKDEIPICPECKQYLRPHVLWFDESYDNELFGFGKSLRYASGADILLVVGTALQTTLPIYVVKTVYQYKGIVVEINPKPVLTKQRSEDMIFSMGATEFFEQFWDALTSS